MADGAELPATGGLPAVPPGGPDAVPAEVGDGGLVQPHNIEMEQALLGALLVQNEVYAQVEGTLRPEHFYDPYHRRIYEKIQGLIQKRLLATPVTLKSFLVEEPGYEEMGGAAYLVALAEHVVSLRAVPDYAAALRELAMRRDLVAIGDDIRWRAARFDTDEPPDNQIALAEQQLYTLAETGTAMGGFKPFLAGMTEAVKQAQLARQRGSDIAGLSTGLKALDEAIGGLRNSDLLILAARPSMGKTALALNIAYAVARQRLRDTIDPHRKGEAQGGVVGFFSLEMSAQQLANRLLAAESRIKSHKLLTGDLREDEFHRFVDVARDLNGLPLHIDDTPALPISALATRARRLQRGPGLDLLVIDYLQLVRPASGRDNGRVQEVSEITQGLKAIAKELDIPVIALSQLSRKVEDREDKRPQLSDLRESGSIEQDADVVMFIFRESYYHERLKPREDHESFPEWLSEAEKLHGRAEVIIGKQRHGPIGTAVLHYEDSFTQFSDPVSYDSSYFDRSGPPATEVSPGAFS